jgi:predicted O-linked N-acetylglucosamine transferase (SPINDLY family)
MAGGKNFRVLFEDAARAMNAGNVAAAETLLREVIALRPRHPEALHLLGVLCAQSGRVAEAAELLRQAVALKPYFTEAQSNLGAALVAAGQVAEAETMLRQVLLLRPDHAYSHSNLGRALQQQGKIDEAITSYRRALQLNPNFIETHYRLATALAERGEISAAIAACEQALLCEPRFLDARNGLANLLREVGREHDALALYRGVIAADPGHVEAHASLLTLLNGLPDAPPVEIFREHVLWDERHARSLRQGAAPHTNSKDPDRRLRIGYVSGDFFSHSVAYFIEPLLAAHDRDRVELFAYADVARPDAVTQRLRGHVPNWRNISGMSNPQLADTVRGDAIDLLVDLGGHTAGNRLLAFARKPAPVQVTYLGYPNTTGMSAMDYRLTDARADPPGAEALHSEKLMRLPDTFLCYRPPEDAPPVAAPPATANGFVTFGSFNAVSKINDPLLDLWARVLAAVPGSRLLLKAKHLSAEINRRRVHGAMAARGVDAGRVELLPPTARVPEHLALYGRMDVALDSFPYHGTTTTCEALWMGVPVVTLAGDRHVSRVGVSLLTTVGLAECIAATEAEYVARAAALAGDAGRLKTLRTGMREQVRASALCDAPRFARNVEAAYRDMWRTWCVT